MKLFKPTDQLEAKVRDAQLKGYEAIDLAKQEMYDDAWYSMVFGQVLHDAKADSMAGALTREMYANSYPEIHELFTRPGTFEFYMNVFRKIWGDNVEVEFEIPSPGVLNINISATNLELQDFMAREIVAGLYVYDEVVTSDTFENIVFQGTRGIKTQQEVDVLINELHPAGIIVTANLVI